MTAFVHFAVCVALSGLPQDPTLHEKAPRQAPVELFPSASAELVVPGGADEPLSIAALAAEYGRLTGQAFTFDQETTQILPSLSVRLSTPLVVPYEGVQAFFEGVLRENNLCLKIVQAGEPRVLTLVSFMGQRRQSIRSDALYVPATRFDLMERHPAVMFTTSLSLPGLDVRQLANSMRSMVVDNNVQQILPAGAGDSLILSGTGDWVGGMVRMLRDAEEQAALSSRVRKLERFVLQNADPAEAVHLVSSLMETLTGQGQPLPAPNPQAPPACRAVADLRTKSLIVLATEDVLVVVREAVQMLDVP